MNRLKRIYKKSKKPIGIALDYLNNLAIDLGIIKLGGIIFQDKLFHTYFGYYDITPFDYSEKKVLALKVNRQSIAHGEKTQARIGYIDLNLEKPDFKQLGISESWNWQQGCRLRWYPDLSGKYVLYNNFIDNHNCAIIQNVENCKIEKIISLPLYDVDSTGEWGISINFSRLHRLRPGYGYDNLPDSTYLDFLPDNDGIWLVNLKKNTSDLLYSTKEIASISPHESMKGAEHYINHISINPNGSHFSFFHLWKSDQGKRYSRLFISNLQGKNLRLINNSGLVSHYSWLSNEDILVTTFISGQRFGFVSYSIDTGSNRIIGPDQLTIDGHPTYILSRDYLVTDSYPDEFSYQNLYLFNLEDGNLLRINRFYSPPEFHGENRCDLHPRISRSGNLICTDIVKNHARAIFIKNIEKIFV